MNTPIIPSQENLGTSEVLDQVIDRVPTFDEMEEIVKSGDQGNREHGITLFRIIQGRKNKSWKTQIYSGRDPVVTEDGEPAYVVYIQDKLKDSPENALVFPVTLHSHPKETGHGNGSHILPSGYYVENSPRGEYGDLFIIDDARLHGHNFLNPLIIMTDIGITFPIGVINSDTNKDHEAIELLKRRKIRPDDPFSTVIWSIWEDGEYEMFERDKDDDAGLSDSLKKGHTVTRLTEKDADNYRKEVYLLTVSWDKLKQYLKDQAIDETEFWTRLSLYDSGLSDFAKYTTDGDLPKELVPSSNLLEFISHFED